MLAAFERATRIWTRRRRGFNRAVRVGGAGGARRKSNTISLLAFLGHLADSGSGRLLFLPSRPGMSRRTRTNGPSGLGSLLWLRARTHAFHFDKNYCGLCENFSRLPSHSSGHKSHLFVALRSATFRHTPPRFFLFRSVFVAAGDLYFPRIRKRKQGEAGRQGQLQRAVGGEHVNNSPVHVDATQPLPGRRVVVTGTRQRERRREALDGTLAASSRLTAHRTLLQHFEPSGTRGKMIVSCKKFAAPWR